LKTGRASRPLPVFIWEGDDPAWLKCTAHTTDHGICDGICELWARLCVMTDMGRSARVWLFLFAGLVAPLTAQQPREASAIVAQMATHMDAALEARRQYVYHQHVRSNLSQSDGQEICRESRDYTVVPQEKSTDKALVSFSGECRQGKRMVPYAQPSATSPGLKDRATNKNDNSGRESIAGFIDDLANDSKSPDGIAHQLFPLTTEEIRYYQFTLKGEATVKGRRAFDLTFVPIEATGLCFQIGEDKSRYQIHADLGRDGSPPSASSACRSWQGEVWIDEEDYQPIRIDTKLAKGIPWGIRVFMGINIRQLGFSLTYERVAPGVWFPATYGTEFRVQVFWGYKRTVTLSMENTDFRKTDAESTVQFESPQ
jgi:hypothetical protein